MAKIKCVLCNYETRVQNKLFNHIGKTHSNDNALRILICFRNNIISTVICFRPRRSVEAFGELISDASSYKTVLNAELQKSKQSERVIKECIGKTFATRSQMLHVKLGASNILKEFSFLCNGNYV